jgi:hypothetical protein
MPDSPYLYERQTEFWTSRQIEEFYLDLGFNVIPFPLTQLAERELPSDFIFFDKDRSKLFGLQYKALYHNGDEYWPIDERQHSDLSRYPWMYYCLSEMKSVHSPRTALHYVRILKPDFEYRRKLHPRWDDNGIRLYSRWGAFYQNLEKCYNGVVVKSEKHLRELLTFNSNDVHLKRVVDMAVDIFLTDFESKNAIHFSPFLTRSAGPESGSA